MPGLLIKNVPEDLRAKLKARATRNRRSMSREVLHMLERFLSDGAGPTTLDEIDAMRVRGRRILTQRMLDDARREGRP